MATPEADPIDAYAAAQTVAAGRADIVPKTHDGAAESLRVLHNARTCRRQGTYPGDPSDPQPAHHRPDALRAQLRGLAASDLIATCSHLRPTGDLATPMAAAKFTCAAWPADTRIWTTKSPTTTPS
ncbi:hypothetical protein [Streptomyces noursei]|uniref:hypothetical protein n=1 Tax=Streptomyces noursei TaxID=1971 RepID=UPI000C9CD009|nr:hypothetical protein [Streptomyces noursei]